ncbi:hypothetical protein [Telmatospirillum sp. J64-1]|uniref:hypothetical protein n=1 Tax=Telmatospirillum sp. J64-1 TaxID=2502183 RepID=UPI00115E7808|nr:hypothetical protein [Telmatospirillum sp. J64-1]
MKLRSLTLVVGAATLLAACGQLMGGDQQAQDPFAAPQTSQQQSGLDTSPQTPQTTEPMQQQQFIQPDGEVGEPTYGTTQPGTQSGW